MNAAAHIAYVTQTYRVSKEALLGPSKAAAVSKPRQELYFRLAIVRGLSLPQAARLIGDRDHTTVLYGLRRYAARTLGTPAGASLTIIREAWQREQQEAAA